MAIAFHAEQGQLWHSTRMGFLCIRIDQFRFNIVNNLPFCTIAELRKRQGVVNAFGSEAHGIQPEAGTQTKGG